MNENPVKGNQKGMHFVCGKLAGTATTTQPHRQSNGQNRHTRERASQKYLKDSHIPVRAWETVADPAKDGTPLRTTATLQSLKHWRDIHVDLLQHSMGNGYAHLGAMARKQQGISSILSSDVYSTIQNYENRINLMMGRQWLLLL